jgi:hypothetical protein
MAAEEPPKPDKELFFSEEMQDDADDYLSYLAYMAEVAKEQGTLE